MDKHAERIKQLCGINAASGPPLSREMWDATFGDAVPKVHRMLFEMKQVYGVEYVPVIVKTDLTKLAFVGLSYPQETWDIFIKEPQDQLPKRLKKRKLRSACGTYEGVPYITIYWPPNDLVHLADVWADTDAAGATCLAMTDHGMVCGTVQKF